MNTLILLMSLYAADVQDLTKDDLERLKHHENGPTAEEVKEGKEMLKYMDEKTSETQTLEE